MLPWTDRTGRFSWLRCITVLAVVAPAAWIALEAHLGWLGPRPVTEAIHQSGLWAIRFLALTLAVTPLRNASRMSALLSIRRMLGLSVLAYAGLHVCLYVVDQKLAFGHVATEIASRIYLTIGFFGFVGFALLGATSTDRMIARLGARRWSRLHQFVYPGAAMVTVHFFMQSKLDVVQPIVMAGIFGLLLGFRAAQRRFGDLSVGRVALVGAAAACATAFGEAAWYFLSMGAPIVLVVASNLDFSFTIRPAWYVLAAAAVFVVARVMRRSDSGARARLASASGPVTSRRGTDFGRGAGVADGPRERLLCE
jgi:sulfoxide reductase heme-binding subunit YedZ